MDVIPVIGQFKWQAPPSPTAPSPLLLGPSLNTALNVANKILMPWLCRRAWQFLCHKWNPVLNVASDLYLVRCGGVAVVPLCPWFAYSIHPAQAEGAS